MQTGTQLGHYEILSALGKGGMGEVWRARDSKLGREVAIKTLPEEFAKDEERLARFEREAKLLASLNHPNIAAIYGLEEHNGTRFLVLELVEGDTLAERLKRGAIPVEESLTLALQIAEALEAAHENGVIHRDLKPANIKVTPDGKVKVLDFGLAKAFAGDRADASLSNSPTVSMQATQKGVILGTAAYMSPEQASGDTTDKRADVWSFGVVLFEMVTGRQTFDGKTVAHVLADVLRAEPEWNSLPPNLHPRLRLLLERCLEKESKDRYGDISDARVDIQRVLADPGGLLVQPVAEVVQAAPQAKLPWVAAFALGLALAGIAVWNLKPDAPGIVGRFSQLLPEGQQFTRTSRPLVAVSPDGSRIVYVANQQLYLKPMDTLEASPIPGTDEDPAAPFFSTDGQWIGYWSGDDGQLKKIPVSGGAPMMITDAGNPLGAPTWEADDTIVFGQPEGINGVSASGGEAELLVAGTNLTSPQMLPDGQTLLFSVANEIAVQPSNSDERTLLLPGQNPRYVSTGHIVYGIEDDLFAVPFDVDSLELRGGRGPVSLVEGLDDIRHYSVSDSGVLVYVPGGGSLSEERTVVWVDRDGDAEPIANIPTGGYGRPRISPDGDRLLIRADDDLWIYDIANGRRDAVTIDGTTGDYTAWSPDGSQVAYSSSRSGGVMEAWIQPADGSGEAKQLTTDSDGSVHVDSWSPIGEVLAVHQHALGGTDILVIPQPDADATPQPFLDEEQYGEGNAQFSPDGRFVAYLSTRTGENQVYVRPYPGPGAPETVSVDGGVELIWGANGELFYRYPVTHALMSVVVSTEPILRVGVPELLFDEPGFAGFTLSGSPRAWFDVSRDGQRFVMLQQPLDIAMSGVAQSKINIVLNWFQELKERVPVN